MRHWLGVGPIPVMPFIGGRPLLHIKMVKKKLDVQDLQKMEEPAQDIENSWHGMKKPTAASRMKSISPFFPLAMRNYT